MTKTPETSAQIGSVPVLSRVRLGATIDPVTPHELRNIASKDAAIKECINTIIAGVDDPERDKILDHLSMEVLNNILPHLKPTPESPINPSTVADPSLYSKAVRALEARCLLMNTQHFRRETMAINRKAREQGEPELSTFPEELGFFPDPHQPSFFAQLNLKPEDFGLNKKACRVIERRDNTIAAAMRLKHTRKAS